MNGEEWPPNDFVTEAFLQSLQRRDHFFARPVATGPRRTRPSPSGARDAAVAARRRASTPGAPPRAARGQRAGAARGVGGVAPPPRAPSIRDAAAQSRVLGPQWEDHASRLHLLR